MYSITSGVRSPMLFIPAFRWRRGEKTVSSSQWDSVSYSTFSSRSHMGKPRMGPSSWCFRNSSGESYLLEDLRSFAWDGLLAFYVLGSLWQARLQAPGTQWQCLVLFYPPSFPTLKWSSGFVWMPRSCVSRLSSYGTWTYGPCHGPHLSCCLPHSAIVCHWVGREGFRLCWAQDIWT